MDLSCAPTLAAHKGKLSRVTVTKENGQHILRFTFCDDLLPHLFTLMSEVISLFATRKITLSFHDHDIRAAPPYSVSNISFTVPNSQRLLVARMLHDLSQECGIAFHIAHQRPAELLNLRL